MDTFSKFGEFIKNVAINFDENISDGKEILKIVNDKASKTLTWMELRSCEGDILDAIKIPFKNVKTLKFSGSKNQELIPRNNNSSSDGRKLSKMFPNLKCLEVFETKALDWKFINGHISCLTELYLNDDTRILPNSLENVKFEWISNFLKENPQIEILIIRNPEILFRKEISDFLPNLKILKITQRLNEKDSDDNQFKDFSFESSQCLFKQIETLDLDLFPNVTSNWMNFIKHSVNKNLTTLNIASQNGLTLEDFQIIGQTFTGLKTLIIYSYIDLKSFSANDIIGFLNTFTSLYTAEISVEIKLSEQYDLQEKLSTNWTIQFKMIFGYKYKINIIANRLVMDISFEFWA